jgi:tetratricopeptide (TPR) repeat protein
MSLSREQVAAGPEAASLRQELGWLLVNKDFARAGELAGRSIAAGGADPYVFMVDALCHDNAGAFDRARAQLRRALELDPDNAFAMATLANTFLRQGDGPGALGVYCEMLQKNISCALAFHGAGVALELMGDEDGAIASYRHAAELDGANAEPLGALALLTLRRRKADARAYAEQALAIDPGQPSARLVLAQLDMDEGRAGAAVERLAPLSGRPALAPAHQAMAHRLRADAFDKLGRAAEAFEAYAASASIFREQYAAQCAGPQPMAGLDLCGALEQSYRLAGPQAWRPAPGDSASGGAARHVFVVGFPRSGTTLLEQVLASHPEVAALEERPTLTGAIDAYLDPPGNIDAMIDMDEASAARWREAYWANVRAFGVEPAGKVFVDKQPFYTLWLPLIGKLFPDARIVIVRRDPRDIVWSCFRRPFRMTPVTYELMDLERAARLYDKAMGIVQSFVEKSSNPVFAYRHEDLIDDFDGVSAGLCDFLGLAWTERLRAFADTARDRDIRTPSAAQVVRGLNRDGVGAWRRYAEPLAAVMPILEPWAQAYGYGS